MAESLRSVLGPGILTHAGAPFPERVAPERVLWAAGGMPGAALVRHGSCWLVTADPVERVVDEDCWDALTQPVRSEPAAAPMAGGWIGLLAYDAATMLERLPAPHADAGGPRRATLARHDAAVAIAPDGTWRVEATSPAAARRLLDGMDPDRSPRDVDGGAAEPPPSVATSLADDEYRAGVRRIRELIAAGDCYQVNLSMRLTAPWRRTPEAFAARLWRAASGGAERAYLALPEGTLVSASPELLVRVEHGPGGAEALSSPIKGTAPPGGEAVLAASGKDRSEHVMIVDLIRNDLGRVAEPGGVRVPLLAGRLRTPYVEHLVSDVRARLRADVTPAAVLGALFPGGSVTGCPKIRAMEVIRALEPVARGPAFGSAVAVGVDGSVEASILIRTAWLAGGEARYWAGGAVVWDSDPDAELAEAWMKARPFLDAIGVP